MMHLKNIKADNAKTLEQYELTKRHGVIWLYAEDGQNWYEAQKAFQADTLKIAYDDRGIIRYIEKDVSSINPEGMSVVELPDTTANRRADILGDWVFQDGKVMKRPGLMKNYVNWLKFRNRFCCDRPERKRSAGKHNLRWELSAIQTGKDSLTGCYTCSRLMPQIPLFFL